MWEQDPEPSDKSLAESMLLVFGQLGRIESKVAGVSKETKGVAKEVNRLTNVIIFIFIAMPLLFFFVF